MSNVSRSRSRICTPAPRGRFTLGLRPLSFAFGILAALLSVTSWWLGRPNRDGFDPGVRGANSRGSSVVALAVQSDGRILVGGDFASIDRTERAQLARLRTDGSIDPDFAAGNPDAEVWAIALQPDSRILIGGDFTQIGGTPRQHVARLNADGSVDPTFVAKTDDTVRTIAVQTDGRIVLGGTFSHVDGQVHGRIARVNADGSIDPSFAASVDGDSMLRYGVYALAVQSDGKIVFGGEFNSLNRRDTHCVAICRLNADGSVDEGFTDHKRLLAARVDAMLAGGHPPAGGLGKQDLAGYVRTLALQSDGKVLLGGKFNGRAGEATPIHNIARLGSDGSFDRTFHPAVDHTVEALAVMADGSIIVAGDFSVVDGAARNNLARLDADGHLDAAFDPNADHAVDALAVQRDGKILIGGHFYTLGGGATQRRRIARLNGDGSVDRSRQVGL